MKVEIPAISAGREILEAKRICGTDSTWNLRRGLGRIEVSH
jgi:hypothetical protein